MYYDFYHIILKNIKNKPIQVSFLHFLLKKIFFFHFYIFFLVKIIDFFIHLHDKGKNYVN